MRLGDSATPRVITRPIHLRLLPPPLLPREITFPLGASCTASFRHVTFSRALRTAIIVGRPNTKVFYDVAHPDRSPGNSSPRGRTKRPGHKKKAIRALRAGKGGHEKGKENGREGKRETEREE